MIDLFIVFILGCCGAYLHYFASLVNGKLSCDLSAYLLVDLASTFRALVGVFLSALVLVSTSIFDADSTQSIAMAILAGYTSDSALNRL